MGVRALVVSLLVGAFATLLGACASQHEAAPVAPTRSAESALRGASAEHAGRWTTLGASRQGRPILAATLASANHERQRAGPTPRLYIIASIHGNETEGLAVIDQLADDLRAIPSAATIRIVRDMNPDGTAARSRTNAEGIDLNRNWPARSFTPSSDRGPAPLSEPESAAILADLERFAPTLVIVLHSTAAGPFVNYDGPAADAATRFATAAVAHDSRWRVVPDMGYPTPGSIGSLIGDDRQIPILTIEFRRGQSPESVWPALRDGVRAVVEPR